MSISQSQRIVEASRMALRGYRTNSINTQTLLSKNQIRRVVKELVDRGHDVSRKSGKPPSPAYIIRKRNALLEGSIFVSCYFGLSEQDPTKPFSDVSIATMDTAYDFYLEYRKDVPGFGDNKISKPLPIDHCYTIVSGLRTRDMHIDEAAFVDRCKTCSSVYLYTLKQSTKTDCVFCTWRGKPCDENSEEE